MTKAMRRAGAVLLAASLALVSACGGPESHEETFFVADTLVPCQSFFLGQCMQKGPSANGPWTYFFEGIEGFRWEPGFVYELRVRVSEVPDPPADGSSRRFDLIRVIARIPVPPPQ